MSPSAPVLRCIRCEARSPIRPEFLGCPACARPGQPGAALELAYDLAAWRARGLLQTWQEDWRRRDGGLWRFRELLPLPEGAEPVSLEEGTTPLVRLQHEGPGRIWLKDETRNPTGAFKDRLHAVGLTMARALGFTGATAATTGNHGTSLAAYAARSGLRALVFCDPRVPELQRRLMAAYGAQVVVAADRGAHLEWLVRERGWYPAVGLAPDPVGSPFGAEGYKTIGFETYFQLGGRFPDRVLVPSSGGDSVYGPWKGFRELAGLGASGRLPRMIAVQPAGCDPIVRAWKAGADVVATHPDPRTLAPSIGDASGGPLPLVAIRESGGAALAMTDAALAEARSRLVRQGIVVEPAGAAGVAAALALAAGGELGPDDDVVCILTGTGIKWPDTLLGLGGGARLDDGRPEALRSWLEALAPATSA